MANLERLTTEWDLENGYYPKRLMDILSLH